MHSTDVLYFVCSLTTTCICIILKLPQLSTIYRTKSTHGVSIASLMLEFWAYLTMLSYSFANNYPISVYSEYPFLVIQEIILISMILFYNQSLNMKWMTIISLMLTLHASIGFQILPSIVPLIAIQIGTPIAWYSKWLQFWTIYSSKDAGQVSSLSWMLNSIATAARLISMFISVWDKIIMTSLFVSFILNSSVAIAAHVYKPKLKTN